MSAMGTPAMFRPQARARGPASERLDERVRIVPPYWWLALAAALAVIAAGLAWGFLGNVPREVSGAGIITGAPHAFSVAATEPGVLVSDPLAAGTRVEAGQVIARVRGADRSVELVRAPISGRTACDCTVRGEPVAPGQKLELVLPGGPPVAYLFLDEAQGERVSVGMPVKLAPGGTTPQEDGLLEGRVTRVVSYPVDSDRVELITGQPHLTGQFLGGEARIEVDVRLARDAQTASGLRWTNGRGPARPLRAGTVIEGSVEIASERPISLLLAD